VPGQLTVTGFDDIQLAGWPLIALTTVRCDLAALARTAVNLLLAEIAGRDGKSSANPFPPDAPGASDPPGAGTDGKSPVARIPVSLIPRGTHAQPRQ
jgi:LacI family transcriptional regulator